MFVTIYTNDGRGKIELHATCVTYTNKRLTVDNILGMSNVTHRFNNISAFSVRQAAFRTTSDIIWKNNHHKEEVVLGACVRGDYIDLFTGQHDKSMFGHRVDPSRVKSLVFRV